MKNTHLFNQNDPLKHWNRENRMIFLATETPSEKPNSAQELIEKTRKRLGVFKQEMKNDYLDTSQDNGEYMVKQKDTLSGIAKKYNIKKWKALAVFNHIFNEVYQTKSPKTEKELSVIYANKTLYIPNQKFLDLFDQKQDAMLVAANVARETTQSEQYEKRHGETAEDVEDAATQSPYDPTYSIHNDVPTEVPSAARQIQSAQENTLQATQKMNRLDEYSEEHLKDVFNIETHGRIDMANDKGLLGLFLKGKAPAIIEYFRNYQDPRTADTKNLKKEIPGFIMETTIASLFVTNVENLAYLAAHGALRNTIPITIVGKLGEIDLGLRGGHNEVMMEKDLQFLAQLTEIHKKLTEKLKGNKKLLEALNVTPNSKNHKEAQKIIEEEAKKLEQDPEIQELLQNFTYLVNFGEKTRLESVKTSIEEAQKATDEKFLEKTLEAAVHLSPEERKSLMEKVAAFQKDPSKKQAVLDEMTRIQQNAETKLANYISLEEYNTLEETERGGKMPYYLDETLISEHMQTAETQIQGAKETGQRDVLYKTAQAQEDGTITDEEKAELAKDAEALDDTSSQTQQEIEHEEQIMHEHAHNEYHGVRRAEAPINKMVFLGVTEGSRKSWKRFTEALTGKNRSMNIETMKGKIAEITKEYEQYNTDLEKHPEGKHDCKFHEKYDELAKKTELVLKEEGPQTLENIERNMTFITGIERKTLIGAYALFKNGKTAQEILQKYPKKEQKQLEWVITNIFPIFNSLNIKTLDPTNENFRSGNFNTTEVNESFTAEEWGKMAPAIRLLKENAIQKIWNEIDPKGEKRQKYVIYAVLGEHFEAKLDILKTNLKTKEAQAELQTLSAFIQDVIKGNLDEEQKRVLVQIGRNIDDIYGLTTALQEVDIKGIEENRSLHPDTAKTIQTIIEIRDKTETIHADYLIAGLEILTKGPTDDLTKKLEGYDTELQKLAEQLKTEGDKLGKLNEQTPENLKEIRKLQDEKLKKDVETQYEALQETDSPKAKLLKSCKETNDLIEQKAGVQVPVGPKTFLEGQKAPLEEEPEKIGSRILEEKEPTETEWQKASEKAEDFYDLLKKIDVTDWNKFEKNLSQELGLKELQEWHTPATTSRFGMLGLDNAEKIGNHYTSNIHMLFLLLPEEKEKGKTRPPILDTWQKTLERAGLNVPMSELMEAVSQGHFISRAEALERYEKSVNTGALGFYPEEGNFNADFQFQGRDGVPDTAVFEINLKRRVNFPATPTNDAKTVDIWYNIALRDKCLNINIPHEQFIELEEITRPREEVPQPEQPKEIPFVPFVKKLSKLLIPGRFHVGGGGGGEALKPKIPTEPGGGGPRH